MKIVEQWSEKEVKPTKGSVRLFFFFLSPSKLEMTTYFNFNVLKGMARKFLIGYSHSENQKAASQSNSIFLWSDC